MKKAMRFSAGFMVLLVLSVFVSGGLTAGAVAEYPQYYGDVDGDWQITSTDARMILMCCAGKIGDTDEWNMTHADVDGDDKITTSDARIVLQATAGKRNYSCVGNRLVIVYSLNEDGTFAITIEPPKLTWAYGVRRGE